MNWSFSILFGEFKPLAVLFLWRAWLLALVCAELWACLPQTPLSAKVEGLKMLAHKGK